MIPAFCFLLLIVLYHRFHKLFKDEDIVRSRR